jgi:hypothetical protein
MPPDRAMRAAPVVVLGAARSGTSVLRDAIAGHLGLPAVPFDINYVWKFGNYDVPHDELGPEHLTARRARFIRRYIERHAAAGSAAVVEKTVSNTLRVGFVRAVLPECRFVHVVRDGRDVAVSARRMWQAPPELRRLLGKVRGFPLRAVPRYGMSYLGAYLRRHGGRNGALPTWGPRFAGIDELVRRRPLLEVCALQWRRSVEATRDALRDVPPQAVVTVRYERLVAQPDEELGRIAELLDLRGAPPRPSATLPAFHPRSVGGWRRELAPAERAGLVEELGPLLTELGYGLE